MHVHMVDVEGVDVGGAVRTGVTTIRNYLLHNYLGGVYAQHK